MSNKKCCAKKTYICHEECCEPRHKKCCNRCCHRKSNPCCKKESNCCERREECYCSERKWCVRPCKTCCYCCEYDPSDPVDPVDPIIPPIIPPITPPVDPCKPSHKKCYKCCKSCYNPCCNDCCNPCDNCCNRYEPCCDLSCSTCYHCHEHHDPKPDPKPKCGGLVPQSFATFANNQQTTTPVRTPFTFNQVGTGTNDICLTSPSTILVKTAGTYNIAYSVGVSITANEIPMNHRVNLYVNFVKQSNSHPNYSGNQNCPQLCMNIVGTQQITIPQNAVITLVNDSQEVGGGSITTCANGTNPVILTITRVK